MPANNKKTKKRLRYSSSVNSRYFGKGEAPSRISKEHVVYPNSPKPMKVNTTPPFDEPNNFRNLTGLTLENTRTAKQRRNMNHLVGKKSVFNPRSLEIGREAALESAYQTGLAHFKKGQFGYSNRNRNFSNESNTNNNGIIRSPTQKRSRGSSNNGNNSNSNNSFSNFNVGKLNPAYVRRR